MAHMDKASVEQRALIKNLLTNMLTNSITSAFA